MTMEGKRKRLRCKACRTKTTHKATVRETSPKELKQARVRGRWLLAVEVAVLVPAFMFLRIPLQS